MILWILYADAGWHAIRQSRPEETLCGFETGQAAARDGPRPEPPAPSQDPCPDCFAKAQTFRETLQRLATSAEASEKLRELSNPQLAKLLAEHVLADEDITSPRYALIEAACERLGYRFKEGKVKG